MLASSEVKGKWKSALEILRKLYGDALWSDLVDLLANKVKMDRLERGAGEKPVLRKYDPNLPA